MSLASWKQQKNSALNFRESDLCQLRHETCRRLILILIIAACHPASISIWLSASSSSLDMIMIDFIRVHEFNMYTYREAFHIATQGSKFSFVFLCDAESAANCEPPRFVFFYLINPNTSFRNQLTSEAAGAPPYLPQLFSLFQSPSVEAASSSKL